MTVASYGIVGGGIVGLAIGRELTRRFPGVQVQVFEAEDRLAAHQTGHNSGVVHAGIYYQPGSLKADLCTRGRALIQEYAAEHGVAYRECGKLVVAVDPSELGRFEALAQTASRNGVPDLRRVEGEGITEIEPHAAGLAALHSPRTAITDFVGIAHAMAAEIEAAGGAVRVSAPVTAIERGATRTRLTVGGQHGAQVHEFDHVILAAGLQSDRVAGLAGGADDPRIIPFRGEYMVVRAPLQEMVNGMIYPVPDPRYPFLGVHFTRRVTGELEVGPNAVLALARDEYRRTALRLQDLRDVAAWPGFWRMARTHWRTGITEMRGSLSVKTYMAAAQRYVPEIGAGDVLRGGMGIRAQAVARDGSLIDDFRITHDEGVTAIRNAPSPAATSSLAIASYVVDGLPAGTGRRD